MEILALERHADRMELGAAWLRHYRWVVVTRGNLTVDQAPVYTVWLSPDDTIGESRYALTQTRRLGFAATLARASAESDQEREMLSVAL